MSATDAFKEAINAGDAARVKALITADPDSVNLCDPDGMTPLHFAARRGQVAVAELLLRHGASVNGAPNPLTPLHAAAGEGQLEMVQFLVARGADLTAKDPWYGVTPLGWAKYCKQQAVADYLKGLH